MEFKSELLLEFECDRQCVCNLNGLTVVTTGVPCGHRFDNAHGLFVESGVTAAEDADVFNLTGCYKPFLPQRVLFPG